MHTYEEGRKENEYTKEEEEKKNINNTTLNRMLCKIYKEKDRLVNIRDTYWNLELCVH